MNERKTIRCTKCIHYRYIDYDTDSEYRCKKLNATLEEPYKQIFCVHYKAIGDLK